MLVQGNQAYARWLRSPAAHWFILVTADWPVELITLGSSYFGPRPSTCACKWTNICVYQFSIRNGDSYEDTACLKVLGGWAKWNVAVVLQGCDEVITSRLTKLLGSVWSKDWRESVIVPSYKKGDRSSCEKQELVGYALHLDSSGALFSIDYRVLTTDVCVRAKTVSVMVEVVLTKFSLRDRS